MMESKVLSFLSKPEIAALTLVSIVAVKASPSFHVALCHPSCFRKVLKLEAAFKFSKTA